MKSEVKNKELGILMKKFTLLAIVGVALALLFLAGSTDAISKTDENLRFVPLKEHIGEEENVSLNIYFIGFPPELSGQLQKQVRNRLSGLNIIDAKPWWIPNMPKYGHEFALADAPSWLPKELVPPDGKIRYDAFSMEKVGDQWIPKKELEDLVDDWHQNVDIVNYVEHEGSLVNVRWKAAPVQISFHQVEDFEELYPLLENSKKELVSNNPPATYTLYSYDDLFSWLEGKYKIKENKGGATLIFINLAEFANQKYTFYADPKKDIVPAIGNGPVEIQYPQVTTSPENQNVANMMTEVLNGGLTQTKMLAAFDTKCARTVTAQEAGIEIPGMRSTQSICAQWTIEPIRNLLGKKGQRLFVADTTQPIAQYKAGDLTSDELLQQVNDSLFELFRHGVMQTTIKANNVYSEAYELRILTFDLRYDQMDLCLLSKRTGDTIPPSAVTECQVQYTEFPTEKNYTMGDVFDTELAKTSLSLFNPAHWEVNFHPFPFGLQSNGNIDPIQAVQTKAFLRQYINEPTFTGSDGQPVTLKHPPLYRTMKLINESGDLVEITSSWEKGIYPLVALTLFTADKANGGLGIYESFWPDAKVVNTPPFHETGRPAVIPLTLILTPSPDGPLKEKWGTFPANMQVKATMGLISEFGGGGWWVANGGNELGGGLARRDFLTVMPQYFLGKERGSGNPYPYGVMPDGSVKQFYTGGLTGKSMEIGAPHWCNEFESDDANKRTACRDFVKVTTTLQSIETIQHGLGYMHSPEPRKRYHFDGETSSIRRLYELDQDPTDQVGLLLHQMVNMYTTLGTSTVWGQSASDWNGIGPHAGMEASLYRSHAREELTAAETNLAYAIEKYKKGFASDSKILNLLQNAVAIHDKALHQYDDWEYEAVLDSSKHILSLTDQALTKMGEPDRIYDPLLLEAAATSVSEN